MTKSVTSSPLLRNLISSLGFTAVALASFACWAYGGSWLRSETTLYLACAAIFLCFGSLSLHPLVADVTSRSRFFVSFIFAFAGYACAWCLFWFWMHDKRGELFGSLVGCLLMAALFRLFLKRPTSVFTGAAVLFFWHTAGYFGGEWLFDLLGGGRSSLAKMAWGLGYGLGFGIGLTACLRKGANH